MNHQKFLAGLLACTMALALTACCGEAPAEEKVQSAAGDLFSSYNTYRWAVEHGVLN